jgi:hypothetical protein
MRSTPRRKVQCARLQLVPTYLFSKLCIACCFYRNYEDLEASFILLFRGVHVDILTRIFNMRILLLDIRSA